MVCEVGNCHGDFYRSVFEFGTLGNSGIYTATLWLIVGVGPSGMQLSSFGGGDQRYTGPGAH